MYQLIMKKFIRPISIANALLLATAILSSAAISTHISHAQAQTQEAQFICGSSYSKTAKRNVPSTIFWTPTGKSAIVQWVKPLGNYWTPERRCAEFSQRIGKAYQAGTLKYLTNSKKNGSSVICTATEVNGICKNVLMTLRPQDKPLAFLTDLKDVLRGNTVGPVEHSSGEPQIYVEIDWNAVVKNASKAD
jgi:Circadian oscillating protein COP23